MNEINMNFFTEISDKGKDFFFFPLANNNLSEESSLFQIIPTGIFWRKMALDGGNGLRWGKNGRKRRCNKSSTSCSRD